MKIIEEKILTIRNERFILDCDVASLYGVPTKEINQAVRNNPEKFPKGYIFQTTDDEKSEVVKKFDHLGKLKFSPVNPTAFTERGLYMLVKRSGEIISNVLTNDLEESETETEIELNLAMLKIKHKVKKERQRK